MSLTCEGKFFITDWNKNNRISNWWLYKVYGTYY